MNNIPELCIICSKKNDESVLRQLHRIEELTCKAEKVEDITSTDSITISHSLMLSTHMSCPYGMHCNTLRNAELQACTTARRIAPKIAAFIKEADRGQMQEVLYLMQGYFPPAYRVCERMWYKTHHTN